MTTPRFTVHRDDLNGFRRDGVTTLFGSPVSWRCTPDAWPPEIVLWGDADEWALYWGFGPDCGCGQGTKGAPDQVLRLAEVTPTRGAGRYVSPDGRCEVLLSPPEEHYTLRVRWPDGAEEELAVKAANPQYARRVGRERLAYRKDGWQRWRMKWFGDPGMREYRPGGRIVAVRGPLRWDGHRYVLPT